MRSSVSDGMLRDRDIILRKLTAGGEGRVRILAIECVSFFLFSPSYHFSIFSRSNEHTFHGCRSLSFAFHSRSHNLTYGRPPIRYPKLLPQVRKDVILSSM